MCLRSESLDVELKINSGEVPEWWTLEWVCVVVSPVVLSKTEESQSSTAETNNMLYVSLKKSRLW